MQHINVNSPDDDIVQESVMKAIFASIPERETELRSMWDENQENLCFQMHHESSGILLDAGAYKFIRFTPKTLRLFWLGSFIAWEGYRKVQEAIMNDTLPDLQNFNKLLVEFDNLYECKDISNFVMPQGIPEPETFPCTDKCLEIQAAAKLSIISLTWAFLHEIKHIKYQREGTSAPKNCHEESRAEELSCDEYATRFILENIDKRASEATEDKYKLEQLRENSIYFAIFTMVLLSNGNWDETDEHPSMKARIKNINDTIISVNSKQNDLARIVGMMAFSALNLTLDGSPELT